MAPGGEEKTHHEDPPRGGLFDRDQRGGILDIFRVDYEFWKKAADAAQAAINEFVRRMK